MDNQTGLNTLSAIGALSGALAVMAGAFGAHGLEGLLTAGKITQRQLEAFETGADYHLIHAILLVVIGLQAASKLRNASAISLLIGMALFSGSLYIYGVTGSKIAAMITPLGGLSYIIGWLCLAAYFFKAKPLNTAGKP